VDGAEVAFVGRRGADIAGRQQGYGTEGLRGGHTARDGPRKANGHVRRDDHS
jgi:hypothetical protein